MLEYSDESVSLPQPLAVRFIPVEGRSREESVTLDFPVLYGDRRIDVIVVRRMTVAEVEAFVEGARSDANANPPMLYLPDGTMAPRDLLDNLDADDDGRLSEVMTRFLPRYLRRADGLTPSIGGDTPPPSQAA